MLDIRGKLLETSFDQFFPLVYGNAQQINLLIDRWPEWGLLLIPRLKSRLGVEIFHGFAKLPISEVGLHKMSYNFALLIILEFIVKINSIENGIQNL